MPANRGPGLATSRGEPASTLEDGDWILREDEEALGHILGVLEAHGALYRYGAPLDLRWLTHGWSTRTTGCDPSPVRRGPLAAQPTAVQ
jgi:hypothetical protein